MADYNLGTARGKIKVDYDGKGVDQAKKDQEGFRKSTEQSGSGVAAVGKASLVAGAAVAAGLGVAAKAGIDFEKQISAIGAVSGASEQDLETLRKKALQLGADTSFSASEAANAMEELAKAGVSLPDILNGAADATVALAAAGGVELPAAAELASDAMNSFRLSAQDLPHVADLIAGAANASSISVGDFGQSLKQVGAVAHLAGQSFDQTAIAIALMGQQGIKGSDAGTSLKTMLSNLIPSTDKASATMEQLGIITADGANKFVDAQGKMKSLAEVSDILQDALKNLTPVQRQTALETIFGSDAIRAAAILAQNGAEGFDKMATAMGKVTAEEVAAKRLDNTAGAIEQLKGSAETAAISLGTILLPALRALAQFLTTVANAFNSLSPATQKTIGIVAAVAAGILLLVGVTYKIIQAAKAFMVVWRVLNLSFIASPIGLIITAILALIVIIVLIATKTDWFQRLWNAVWGGIKKVAQAVADWFTGPFANFFKRGWDAIVGFFTDAFNLVKGILQTIMNALEPIIKPIGELFRAAFGLAMSAVKLWWSVVSAIFAVFKTVLTAIFSPILKGIVAIFEWAWGKLVDGTKVAWNIIRAITESVWNGIKAVIMAVWNVIGPFVIAAGEKLDAFITGIWNKIKDFTSNVWNGIKIVFQTVWNAITGIVQRAVTSVVNIMNGIKAIVDKVRGFFNQLKAAAEAGPAALIAFVKTIPGKIIGALGNLGSLLYNKGREIIQGMINGIKSMIQKVRDAASSIIGPLARFLPGSPAKEGPLAGQGYVLKRGQRFMDDFASGILSKVNAARDAVASAVTGISGAVPTNMAASVVAAQTGIATAPIAPAVTVAAPGPSSGAVTIQNLNIQGVWDFSDPSVPRQITARLHDAIERYKKDYR